MADQKMEQKEALHRDQLREAYREGFVDARSGVPMDHFESYWRASVTARVVGADRAKSEAEGSR
jgi:hypothetical protein